MSKIVQIETHGSHSFILLNDGKVMGCGANNYGQLGTNNTIRKNGFVYIKTIENVKQIACGDKCTFFLLNDGTVKSCGYNKSGQLGTGDLSIKYNLTVIPNLTNVKEISISNSHVLFLLGDGTVKTCGDNTSGQLGLAHFTNNIYIPTIIPDLNNVKHIQASMYRSVFLLNDDSVKICGLKDISQPQNNERCCVCQPTFVAGSIKNIFSRYDCTYFLSNTNEVFILEKDFKVDPVTGLTNVKTISIGLGREFFLLNDGAVRAHGYNSDGELGIGYKSDYEYGYIQIPNLNNIVNIVSYSGTICIDNNGLLFVFGNNSQYQLGIDSYKSINIPTELNNLFIRPSYEIESIIPNLEKRTFHAKIKYYKTDPISDLSVFIKIKKPTDDFIGGSHIQYKKDGSHDLNDDELTITQNNDFMYIDREFEIPNNEDLCKIDLEFYSNTIMIDEFKSGLYTQFPPYVEPKKAINVYSAYRRNFIIYNDGSVKSCGDKFTGFGISKKIFTNIPDLTNVKQIGCSENFTLFLLKDGTVKVCGEITTACDFGFEKAMSLIKPTTIPNLSNVKNISCGRDEYMFILENGTVKSCGNNNNGQLGLDNNNKFVSTPTLIPNLNNVKQISCAKLNNTTFFLLNDNKTVMMTGGPTGCNTPNYYITDSQIEIKKILATNSTHDCIILYNNGTVKSSSLKYFDFSKYNIIDMTSDYHSTLCFITNTNNVVVYGIDKTGALGLGDTTGINSLVLEQIPEFSNVINVSSGFSQSMFLLKDGTVKVCGANTGESPFESFPAFFNIGIIDSCNIFKPTNIFDIYNSPDITELQDKLNDAYNKIYELENKIKSIQDLLDKANKTIEENNIKINELETTIVELNEEIERLTALIDDLQDQLDNSTGGSSDKDDLILSLKNTIADKDKLIKQLNESIADKDFLISERDKEITKLQNDIIRLNNKIDELNGQIEFLKSQINNSDGDKSQLLEKISMLEKEIADMNEDVIKRIQLIEKKLSDTSLTAETNVNDIEEIKNSIVKDIIDSLGTPRFGVMPLPIGKQAIAVSRELLSDPNTGHLYLKNNNKLVSKTKDNEEKIIELQEYTGATWVSISIDNSNYDNFTTHKNIYENSDTTISSSDNTFTFDKVNIRFNPLAEYLVGVRITNGDVNDVKFIDADGNKIDTKLVNKTDNDFLFTLKPEGVKIDNIYPIIKVSDNTFVETFIIYRTVSMPAISDTNGMIFNGNTDKTLIDKDTILNEDGTFTLTTTNKIKIKIPKESLKCGKYSIIVRCKDIGDEKLTLKTIFNGTLHETHVLDYSKVTSKDSCKSAYAKLHVPHLINTDNYYEISTTSTKPIIVEYIIISMLDIDIDNYYIKSEVDNTINNTKDELNKIINNNIDNINNTIIKVGNNYGVTTGNGSDYTVNIKDIISYGNDGLTVCITPHVTCNNNPRLRINNLAYLQIKNSEGDLVSSEDLKAGIPIILVRVGNYFFIRASVGGDKSTTDSDPNVKPGEGDLVSSDEVEVGQANGYRIVRIVNSENVLLLKNGKELHLWNLKKNKRTLVATDVDSGNKGGNDRTDEVVKMWKDKYYIFGTKIYNLKFKQVAEFPRKTIPDYYRDVSCSDSQRNFSIGRCLNHFILDIDDTNNLYFVEYIPVEYNESHQHRTNYENCFWWERCVISISRVNDDFSLSKTFELGTRTVGKPDHGQVPIVDGYWNRSMLLAIKGNKFYSLRYPFVNTGSKNALIEIMEYVNGEYKQLKTMFPLEARLDYDQTHGRESTYYAGNIASQNVDRMLFIDHDYDYYTSKTDTRNYTKYSYDIITDKTTNTYKYTSKHKDGHRNPSETETGLNIFGGKLTNNPDLFCGKVRYRSRRNEDKDYPCLMGFIDGDFVQSKCEYEGNYTSKYRIEVGNRRELVPDTKPAQYKCYDVFKIYKL